METYISKYKHTCNFLYLGTYIHKHNFSFGAPVLNFQSNETIVLIFEVARVVRIDCRISEFSFHKTINDIVYYPLFYFGPSFHGFDFLSFQNLFVEPLFATILLFLYQFEVDQIHDTAKTEATG